jgi:hypothetical protein
MTITLVSNSIDMRPTLGGPIQRASRLGSRWQADISLPPLSYAGALAWLAILNRASTSTMRIALVQPDMTGLSAGSLLVSGSGQAGTSLSVSGGTASFTLRAGQFISIYDVAGDRYYLHQLTAAYTLSGSGAGVLPIYPPLRSSPPSASSIATNPPIIEGFLTNPSATWSIDVARTVGLQFSILEAE